MKGRDEEGRKDAGTRRVKSLNHRVPASPHPRVFLFHP
jgi:hypothetical protein